MPSRYVSAMAVNHWWWKAADHRKPLFVQIGRPFTWLVVTGDDVITRHDLHLCVQQGNSDFAILEKWVLSDIPGLSDGL